MRVFVAGGTGETGRLVVALLKAGQATHIKVLSRSAERARAVLGDDIEVHEGDVRDLASLENLSRGVDVAILATGTRSYFGKNGGAAVDALGNQNLASALADVGHIVQMSAFGLDRSSVFLTGFSVVLGSYFKWKGQAESAIRQSGVPATIVRPVELRNRPPAGPARLNQAEPLSMLRTISRQRVAEVLVHCCGHEDALGKTFELCEGPEDTPDLDTQLAAMHPEGTRPRAERTPLFGE